MKIVVDVMGGDNAPKEMIRGALQAAAEHGVDVIMAGRGEEILQALKEDGIHEIPKGVEIAHASQVVEMEDMPSSVVREKKDSSLVVGLNLVASGSGDAFVSAGSTGALLTASTLILKRIKGIRRAALAPILPSANGGALLIDCGANVECTPEYLLQFAYMGSYYAEKVMGREKPKLGLLNIGTEETKGTQVHREAYKLFHNAGEEGRIRFIGNVESREVCFGEVDVVVSDGFSGNIMLKTMEGVGLYFAGLMKKMFLKSAKTKLAALLVRDGIADFKRILDYKEVGGAPLLGIAAPVVKAHGSSDARAFASAIRQAKQYTQTGIISQITENIEYMKIATQDEQGMGKSGGESADS